MMLPGLRHNIMKAETGEKKKKKKEKNTLIHFFSTSFRYTNLNLHLNVVMGSWFA